VLCGCDTVGTKALSYLSSSTPVLAVVDGVPYQGSATVALDRTGTVQLVSTQAPERVCSGNFRYTATTTGVLQLYCAGVPTSMAFIALNELKAYGWGGSDANPATFTFGMAPEDAAAYLRMPSAPSAPAPVVPPTPLPAMAVPAPAASAVASPVP